MTGEINTKPNGEESAAFDANGFLGNQPENIAERHVDPNAEKPAESSATEKKVVAETPVEASEAKREVATKAEAPTPKTYQLTLNEDAVGALRGIAGIGEEDEFSLESLTSGYEKLKKENEGYREMLLDQGTLVSDTLNQLKSKLERTEEEKVRSHFKELGYDEDDVDEQVAIFVANDNLEKQAALVDKKIKVAIAAEEASLKESREQQIKNRIDITSGAKLEEVHADTAKLLKEELADVDGFFGLKFGKNAEEIASNKEAFVKKIANVNQARKLLESPKAFAEYAFFQANRETISKVLTSQGVEKGKAIILSEMQNPMKPSQVHQQLAEGEFNATAFVGGE